MLVAKPPRRIAERIRKGRPGGLQAVQERVGGSLPAEGVGHHGPQVERVGALPVPLRLQMVSGAGMLVVLLLQAQERGAGRVRQRRGRAGALAAAGSGVGQQDRHPQRQAATSIRRALRLAP